MRRRPKVIWQSQQKQPEPSKPKSRWMFPMYSSDVALISVALYMAIGLTGIFAGWW